MNKNALRSFAIESRKELIEKIQIKAMQYGIENDNIKNSQAVSSDSIVINGRPLSKEEKLQREKLILKIKSINVDGGDGYKQIIEEVAYTWFNRFTALRFMEVNDYLPTRVRALSSSIPGSVEPELIKEASNVDLKVDKQKIYEMKLSNNVEGLFKYMIIAQCNALNESLPFMFEKIGHYTEILFPDGLLNKNTFIRRLTDTEIIPEIDWKDVEIIGWIFQYYNSEEKAKVIQSKKRYKKEEIPFATQLFTPDWIVRYMVQNTLGRYWMESHPEHSDLKNNWEFYLEKTNSEEDFKEKLAPYRDKELRVEDIKCFDPAMGSGHILVYMFDILYEIYQKCGYSSREIPKHIIENNLYGLDIDDRAYQLACFAVVMRGMKYNNRLLKSIAREAERSGKEGIKLNLVSIQETNELDLKDIEYVAGEKSGDNFEKVKKFVLQFRNAKIFGSLAEIIEFDKEFLIKRLEYITNNPVEDLEYQVSKNKQVDVLLNNLIKQAEIMSQTYEILVTNPPYIGNRHLNSLFSEFIGEKYFNVKSDIFSVFMVYSFSKVKNNGQLGFMTPFVWMFLQSYEKLREIIIREKNISSLVQLEYSGFDEATVPICTFTLKNYKVEIPGEYIRLYEFKGSANQSIKTIEAVKDSNVKYRYSTQAKDFNSIPGSQIAYWASKKIGNIFKNEKQLKELADFKTGLQTGDNETFLRIWHEINYKNFGVGVRNKIQAIESKCKWFPYNKGGMYRKWYGNNEYVVNWGNDGSDIKADKMIRLENGSIEKKNSGCWNEEYYFNEGLTWSLLTSNDISLRYTPEGFLFDTKGSMCFPFSSEDLYYLLALLNSKIIRDVLRIMSPTLDYTPGILSKIPGIKKTDVYEEIETFVTENIAISKSDWDAYESSWNYNRHPLLVYKEESKTIEQSFNKWSEIHNNEFYKLKKNEEEINRIFIEIYGLQNEMTSEVDEKDITISRNDIKRDIKSLISYAVGCMLGRYSLGKEGLVYAGGEFDTSEYIKFEVDEDNILPIVLDSYFEDDIVAKFVEFIKTTFGEETLAENINFIAKTLGKKGRDRKSVV